MAFPSDVVERLLVACHRHCCICHKPAGGKMEIHHIVLKSEGGQDTEENGIPLCFDCHAEVRAYDPKHAKGRKFTPSELKKHKEQWFAICSRAPWESTLAVRSVSPIAIVKIDDSIFDDLRCEDPTPARRLVYSIMQQNMAVRKEFVSRVIDGLKSGDDDKRWNLGMVVEELVLWEPQLVPAEVLECMSTDKSFSVRSSAAMCYYYLAELEPTAVPLDVLARLAAYGEDWYVCTPATGALLRLARARPVVLHILAKDLDHQDAGPRQIAASAIQRLMHRDWDLIPDDLVQRMLQSPDTYVKEVGKACQKTRERAGKEPEKDYSPY